MADVVIEVFTRDGARVDVTIDADHTFDLRDGALQLFVDEDDGGTTCAVMFADGVWDTMVDPRYASIKEIQ